VTGHRFEEAFPYACLGGMETTDLVFVRGLLSLGPPLHQQSIIAFFWQGRRVKKLGRALIQGFPAAKRLW
jgi:hypothetical protein